MAGWVSCARNAHARHPASLSLQPCHLRTLHERCAQLRRGVNEGVDEALATKVALLGREDGAEDVGVDERLPVEHLVA